MGELGLSGELRAVRGIVASLLPLRAAGRSLVAPASNASAAGLVTEATTFCAEHLLEVTGHLNGDLRLSCAVPDSSTPDTLPDIDLSDIQGQDTAKRALLVAAAGGHNILLIGHAWVRQNDACQTPTRLTTGVDTKPSLGVCRHSVAAFGVRGYGSLAPTPLPSPAPHMFECCISSAAVSGSWPGEVSLSHNGVLFLDELPEFTRHALEVLREPLESKFVSISRAIGQTDYPASFQLVGAMNPCPCGWAGGPPGKCECSDEQIRRYRGKVSGPLLDRIDLHINVPSVDLSCLGEAIGLRESETVGFREQVTIVRQTQLHRGGHQNCDLTSNEVARHCRLQPDDRLFLQRVGEQFSLSARAWHRILKVSRTIADLSGELNIQRVHLAEAIGYRLLDRTVT